MTYEPFLIAPFSHGLETDRQPWMLPQDGFSEITNAHIHDGVVEKREGSEFFGDMVYQQQTNWTITAATVADPVVLTLTDVTGLNVDDVIEIRNVDGMTELNGNQYTITAVAGGAGGTVTLGNVDGTTFSTYSANGDVYLIPGTRIMGLERFITDAGVKEVLVFDQKRAALYDTGVGGFVPLDSADIMDGDVTDYIKAANWASASSTSASPIYRLYFTNGLPLSAGVNGIRYYDGATATTASFNPTYNTSITLDGAKLIFADDDRLLVFHTTESGTTYPQRMRWCQQGDPSVWDDNVAGRGGFVDAATGDQIIGGEQLENGFIIYFTNSVWEVVKIGDPALPYTWKKINDFRGLDSRTGTVGFDRYVTAISVRGITACDGTETVRVDNRIENFSTDEVNTSQYEKVFGRRSYGRRQAYYLYPPGEDDEATKALVYDEQSQSYSIYTNTMNVIGYGGVIEDLTIADFGDKTLDEFDNETLFSFVTDEDDELLLGGDREGKIWKMEVGSDDNEVLFESAIKAITQANPGVVTMTAELGIQDGDTVTLSSISGMTELNDRSFTVDAKSGNSFALKGIDTSAYTAYTSGGVVRNRESNPIEMELRSASWNPYIQQGSKSVLGYVDIFLDTAENGELDVEFFTSDLISPNSVVRINQLPDVGEIAYISEITNDNPGVLTVPKHGLRSGAEIFIYNARGMDEINGGPYTVTKIDDNHISLGIDTTNFNDYTEGGVLALRPFAKEKIWKRVYSGQSGYKHTVRISAVDSHQTFRAHAFMPWFKPVARRPI